GDGRPPALLLDLLGGRQAARARRLRRSPLQALDRYLCLRGVRRRRPGRAGRDRPGGRAADAVAARRDEGPLPGDQPLRVDVLGHGPAARGLADLVPVGAAPRASIGPPRSGQRLTSTRCGGSSTERSSSTSARSRCTRPPRLIPSWDGLTASRGVWRRRASSACAPSTSIPTSATPTTTSAVI